MFKYRTVTSKFHLDYLSKRQIYFSSFPENWPDDKMEGLFQLDFRHEDRERYLAMLDEALDVLSESERRVKKEYFLNPINWPKIQEDWTELQKINYINSGIFCTSKDWNSVFCWNKFADNGRGFVIQYDSTSFCRDPFAVNEVYYVAKKPMLPIFGILCLRESDKDFYLKMIEYMRVKYYFKPLEFAPEREIRVSGLFESNEERSLIVDPDHILSVRIGPYASLENRDIIREACKIGDIEEKKIIQLELKK